MPSCLNCDVCRSPSLPPQKDPGKLLTEPLGHSTVNCDLLGPVTVDPAAGGSPGQLDGMCQGWKNMDNQLQVFTYSGDQSRVGKRRRQQCPTGVKRSKCQATKKSLEATTGRDFTSSAANSMIQCDEVPWASSEEGGSFLPQGERRQTCVTSYQNGAWGSSCQGKPHRIRYGCL